MASQYSTLNQTSRADPDNVFCDARRQETRNAAASGLRADERDVKPHGTRRNRTSSAASGAGMGRVRNSQGENKGFFQNLPPPDGPRRSEMATEALPAAFVHVLGNGTIADDGALCPCRLPDTARPPAAATRAAPPARRLCYSTAREDEGERTTSHTPSIDKSAHGNGQGLAAAAKCNHAGHRPRERQLPKVKSRSGESTPLRDAFNSSPPARFPSVQLNHPTPALPLVSAVACHLAPTSPRFIRARPGPLSPRKWPPVSPRLTIGGESIAAGETAGRQPWLPAGRIRQP
jgi:hypothetical protein